MNPNLSKDRIEKVKGEARGKYRRIKTKEQLRSVLKNWRTEWGRPTNAKIAEKAKLSIKQANTYLPKLKAEREAAASLKKPKSQNQNFILLYRALLKWDLSKGVPTNADLAYFTGLTIDRVKKQSPRLKQLKKKIKSKIKEGQTEPLSPYFAPFDSSNFVHQDEPRIKHINAVQNEVILDLEDYFLRAS